MKKSNLKQAISDLEKMEAGKISDFILNNFMGRDLVCQRYVVL